MKSDKNTSGFWKTIRTGLRKLDSQHAFLLLMGLLFLASIFVILNSRTYKDNFITIMALISAFVFFLIIIIKNKH